MNARSGLLTMLFFYFMGSNLSAQDYSSRPDEFGKFIERIFSTQEDDLNYEDLYESLYQYYLTPLDLNTANEEDLRSLLILSEVQVYNFLQYRNQYGEFLSIYELRNIESFDLITINSVLPFVGLNPGIRYEKKLFGRILDSRNFLLIRHSRTLERAAGFLNTETAFDTLLDNSGNIDTILERRSSRFSGSPDQLYLRFRTQNVNDFSIGFTAEKDPGEALRFDSENNQYGAGYYSFHLQLLNKGRLKNSIIGDYTLQAGQGLVFGSGFSPGKGAETINTIRRSNIGIRPYTSVLETGFFRGAALTYEINQSVHSTLFYSRTREDAQLIEIDDVIDTEPFIRSIRNTGLHRTASELAARDQVIQEVFGGMLTYDSRLRDFKLGLTAASTNFNTLIQRPELTRNRFEFSGKQNYNGSLFFSYNRRKINLFGEGAVSKSGGFGVVGGLVSSLTDEIELALLLRNYDRNFHSFFGNAFGESSRNINERGVYWGVKIKPYNKIVLTGYVDRYQFDWTRFSVDFPSNGTEYLARLTYTPTWGTVIYAQFRQENREENGNDDSTIRSLVEQSRRNFILNFDTNPEGPISLKSRVQFSSFSSEDTESNGIAVIQDINFNFNRFRWSNRFAIFDTDDFENRQYVYERNVLYAFSIPAYNGRGIRAYSLLQFQISKKIDFWFRYAVTQLENDDTIGSGLLEIAGNTRQDITSQIRLTF
ncbi:MAG: helix-hairpin-helix domain-containing protein [Bacteroidota bacterium]